MTPPRFQVRLSTQAQRARDELGNQTRRRMDTALRGLAVAAASGKTAQDRRAIRRLPLPDEEAYSIRFDHYVAVCELIRPRELVIVYAVLPRRELERRLGLPPRWTWMEAIPMGWGLSPSQRGRLEARRP